MLFENERISWRKSIRLRQSRQIKERVRNASRHFCIRHASERIGSVSSNTLNLLIEFVTLVLIIFTAIYINYKRRQRDERADDTLATSAEADKRVGR